MPARAALSSVESVCLPDGRTLCARRRGRPGAHPLVLLHGLLDSSAGWSAFCRAIGRPYIAFDLPGFGQSDPPWEATVADYARDIAHGLAAFGVDRFTLVGHSLGGAVAAALTELTPGQVDALILLAPVGFGRIPLAEAATMPGVRTVVKAGLPWALSSRLLVTAAYLVAVTDHRLPPPELVERVTSRSRQLVDGTDQAIRAIAAAGRSAEAFHRRRVGFAGPVTAVWGDRDRLVPSGHQAGLRTAFPQARIETWRGMGHHPANERLGELITLIAAAGQGRPVLRAVDPAADSLADAA
jgi:pimeloyl-ACP methyl ester carboxylesterase